MILVTGATGNIGRHVVTALLDERQEVRALTRDPQRAGLPSAAEVCTGDFDAVETLTPAMKDVDTILLATYGPATGTRDANVAHAAATAGASRIVKISIAGVEAGDSDPVTEWHRAGEEAIDRVGISRTFLRCGELMTTALWWAETIRSMGRVFVPFADSPSAPIDPIDVATVAARRLTDSPSDDSEALVLTGPEVLTSRERVRRLGEMLGTTLDCIEVPREAAFERMVAAGQPPVIACARLDMIEVKSKGPGTVPSDTVETVTGRPAQTFDDWAARNLAAFR
jgi:(4-alkanoyl-5-oxo-2,5-dihydrofuran-3-yl)methyl phosphate reductase